MSLPSTIARSAKALWIALLGVYILAGAAIVPFHGDEATQLFMGRDYHYLFVEGDLSQVLYDRSRTRALDEQQLRLENGTISKTLHGWLAANLGIAADELNRHWHWGRDYDFNLRRNSLPDEGLLKSARLASALQLALATALFFQFVRMTLNEPTAYLASALFALHPNVLINGRRAMMEGSQLLGLMLVLLAAAWLLRERNWRRLALLGLCMGLAVAAKHPNLIICALVCPALIWAALRERGRRWKPLLAFALPPLVAILVFLLLNPAWWSAPLELPAVIIEMRANLLRAQVDWLGGYSSFAERMEGFFQFVFAPAPQYYEVPRWAQYDVISGQIANYESSGLAGLLFGGASWVGLVTLSLTVVGGILLARAPALEANARILVFVWVLGSAFITLLLTPLPWARYYLPLAPGLALLVAYALTELAGAIEPGRSRKTDGAAVLD